MKLVVGLGNPGIEYRKTRHNVGFMVLDNYLGKVSYKDKFDAKYYEKEINNEKILFIKPLTYMNLSGLAISKYVKFYKVNIEDILIIQDDLDIELGSYKLKRNSSSGGHNGINSIIKELNTDEFLRLKIGIGKSELIPTDRYVLSKFSKNELSTLESNFPEYNNIIDEFINNGVEKAIEIGNKK